MLKVAVRKARGEFNLRAQFEAPTPGVVALFGRSGCGKTTTINIVSGLLRPDEGRVELEGAVLEDTVGGIHVPPEERGIGYVFQDGRLFPHFSVLGNLRYGLKRASSSGDIRLDQIVSLLALEPLLSRRPPQLSGGERQRVALGRALLSQPRLLLLDEPLASLDAARREEVVPYLQLLRDSFSIPMVYVSHQFDEVLQLATHVVLMDGGQVLAQGNLTDISLLPELRDLVGSEAVGAVLDGTVQAVDPASSLVTLQVGTGLLNVSARGVAVGKRMRVQLLARDIVLATEEPRALSVRNSLRGHVSEISGDEDNALLIKVDIGGAAVLARITHDALTALKMTVGMQVWVLVKAVSTRGHSFSA